VGPTLPGKGGREPSNDRADQKGFGALEERDTQVDGTKTPELLVDFITLLNVRLAQTRPTTERAKIGGPRG
jgi:hypothetical protein